MNFDVIQEEWSKDCEIDTLNLTRESSETPKLHHKYLKYLMIAKANHRKLLVKLSNFKKLKKEYFQGLLDKEELDSLGWEPFQLKILKSELYKYIEEDADVIKLTSMVGEAQENIFYLEEILRQINSRGFQIKQIIDWERFRSGG